MWKIAKSSRNALLCILVFTVFAIFIKKQYFGKEILIKTVKINGHTISLKFKQKIIWGDAVIELCNDSTGTTKRKKLREVDMAEDVEGFFIQPHGNQQIKVIDGNNGIIKVDDGENPIRLLD